MDLRRRLTVALLMLIAIVSGAVAGYRVLGGPNVTLLQAIYMAVITLAGVGYGEIVETAQNPALRVFNMFVVLIGVAITVYVFSAVTAFLVEGQIRELFRRRKMQKKINALKHHYIVCGLGDTGRYAVEELQKTASPFVVIEQHEETIHRLKEHDSGQYANILYIVGDATDETFLDQAGIDRAAGLIAAVAGDKDNLVITVMAHQKNPSVRIVARCTELKFAERMVRAGAASTVSPNHIGGLRLASEVLRPHVVSFLDLMLKEHSRTLRIEEIEILRESPWVGLSLERLNLKKIHNLMPLALKRPNESAAAHFHVNPADSLLVEAGTVIIVMGDVADVHRARKESMAHPIAATP